MKNRKALIILDMLNTFDFPEGKDLLKRTIPAARNIITLKKRCQKAKIPIIYVNDNFGKWYSDWKMIFKFCTQDTSLGREVAKLLKPQKEDYFVLKPKHSGFYSTNLEPLLRDLKVETLILTGIAGDICVLFTAHDAHMREYKILVPRDCVASNTAKGDRFLIHQLERTMKFAVPRSKNIHLK